MARSHTPLPTLAKDPLLGICYRAIRKVLGDWRSWDPADIDDMANEVGLRLHLAQRQGTLRTTARHAALGFARNVFRETARRKFSYRQHLQGYFDEYRTNSYAREEPVSDLWKSLRVRVRNRLSKSERQMFDYFMDNRSFSAAEAAAELQLSQNAADQRVSRIRKHMFATTREVTDYVTKDFLTTLSVGAEQALLDMSLTHHARMANRCFLGMTLAQHAIFSQYLEEPDGYLERARSLGQLVRGWEHGCPMRAMRQSTIRCVPGPPRRRC